MAKLVKQPAIISAAGNKPKEIREFFGRVNSGTSEVSIAKMNSPAGWIEPGQMPDFDEYTVVLKGILQVKTREDIFLLNEGEAILILADEWVQYSTPKHSGAEYIAVCIPAFSMNTVHRDT